MIYLVHDKDGKIVGKSPNKEWLMGAGIEGEVIEYPEDIDIKEYVVKGSGVTKKNEALIQAEKEKERVDELWLQVRTKRNRLLAKTDFTQLEDSPPDSTKWEAYRKQLRDITNGVDDPAKIVWPTPPTD